VSDVFVRIVWRFLLRFGVTYIVQDQGGNELDIYEYAIVSKLNPSEPTQAICRLVTKKMTLLPYGKTGVIKKSQNLHCQAARRKLVKIDPKRWLK
jgi:hypothetical protein